MIRERDLPPDTRVCNCAGCGVLLLGRTEIETVASLNERELMRWPSIVAGRVKDRPYCAGCLEDLR